MSTEFLSERASRIEQIVRNDYFDDDVVAADLALDELLKNEMRSDSAIAHAVAMRISQ